MDYVPFLFCLATFFLCGDNKPIDLVILYCVVMPFYPSSTKRHETHSLATDFLLFNLDAGYSLGQYSLPSFPYSTQTWISLHEVGFPLIVQIKVFVRMTCRAEDSKLGRWWSGQRSTSSNVADGAIERGYGSKRGSIPEGRREVAPLVVVILRTHYSSELWDGGHPARALGLRGRPCRQCMTSLADDECFNTARPFLPRRICDHR